MSDHPELNELSREFHRERSIRRTLTVLEAKSKSVNNDLERLIRHLKFLLPSTANNSKQSNSHPDLELLKAALERMEDDAFAQLMLALINRNYNC